MDFISCYGFKFFLAKIYIKVFLTPLSRVCQLRIPQTYSFITLGTHGAGFHSLLYFISLLHSNPQNLKADNIARNTHVVGGGGILPISMHALRDEVATDFSLAIKTELLLNSDYATWGITLDGATPKKPQWIQTHLTYKVPAICLVRDPIDLLISALNYNTKCQNTSAYILASLKEIRERSVTPYATTIAFYTNYKQIKPFVKEMLYIDMKELVGESALGGMEKIASFLGFALPKNQDFNMRINDWLTRVMPLKLTINGYKVFVSVFEGHFSSSDAFPFYHARDKRLYIKKDYTHPLFPNRKLFISTTSRHFPDELHNELFQLIDSQIRILYDKTKIYIDNRVTLEKFIATLCENPKIAFDLAKAIESQILHLKATCPQIIESWESYKKFLTMLESK